MGGIGSGRRHFYRDKSKWEKEAVCQKVIELMGGGAIVEAVSKSLGCSRTAFFEALHEFSELNDAYQRGRSDFVAWFDSVFKASMLGIAVFDGNTNQEIKINPAMAIFYAKVHCGWHETDNHTVSVSGGVDIDKKHIERLEKNLELFIQHFTLKDNGNAKTVPSGKPDII
jgi:hypothetical protein